MPDATLADFRAAYPAFAATGDAAVTAALARAYRLTDAGPRAAVCCAAHLLVLDADSVAGLDGGAGEVASEVQGPKVMTYKPMAELGRETWLTQTSYGREVLTLERRSQRQAMAIVTA